MGRIEGCGDVEMWRCGDVEMWRCGDVEMWRVGNLAIAPTLCYN
jgi:hypothetical protein